MIRHAAFFLALLAVATPEAHAAAGLEGRWRLVEPAAGDGPVVQLLIRRQGTALVPSLLVGREPGRSTAWPSFASDSGPAEIVVHAAGLDAARGEIHASYRVPVAGSAGRALEVVERYRLSEDGHALVGTVEILLIEEGEPRGSHRVRRRFEREP